MGLAGITAALILAGGAVACPAPVLVNAKNVFSGCPSATVNTVAYTNPGGSNTVMILRIESGGSSALPSSLPTYGSGTFTKVRSDLGQDSPGVLSTWYLVNPPSGSNTLTIDFASGNSTCSWNVYVSVYSGASQAANPIGANNSTQNTSCPTSFHDSITTLANNSVLEDFIVFSSSEPSETLGGSQTNLSVAGGCCDPIFADEAPEGAAGPQTLTYTSSFCESYTSELIEIQGASCGSSPTPSASPTATPSATPLAGSPTWTPTATASPTPGGPSPTPTHGACLPVVADTGTGNATTAGTPNTSMNFSYTSGGPNALLVLRLAMSSGARATSVTFGGINLVFLRRDVATTVGWAMETWYLVAPPAGTFPIVVTTGFSTQVLAGATTYNGVNQVTPIGANAFSMVSTVTGWSVGLTTISANSLIADSVLMSTGGASVISIGSGQNQEWNVGVGGSTEINGDNTGSSTPGPYTLNYSFSVSINAGAQPIEIESACGQPSFTPTPTAAPTTCETPVFVQSSCVFGGNNVTQNNANITVPAGHSNMLLLIRIQADGTNGQSVPPTYVGYDGLTLSSLAANTVTDGGYLQAWYLVNPPVGTFNLNIASSDGFLGHSWNVEEVVYADVNQSSPIGATAFANRSSASTWSDSLSTLSPGSIIDDYQEIHDQPASFSLNSGQTLETAWCGGGTQVNRGAFLGTTAAGTYSLSYTIDIAKTGAYSALEIEGGPCSSPTPSASPTASPSATPSQTGTRTSTATPSPSPTPTPSMTPQMALTKTSSVLTATIGDTITFCIQWQNDSSATNTINVWDTVPTALAYASCSNACAQSGGVVSWSFSALAHSAGNVCFWGVVAGYPLGPLTREEAAMPAPSSQRQAVFLAGKLFDDSHF
jgi:uncharacterized repeat protein (TIGR01451 family)